MCYSVRPGGFRRESKPGIPVYDVPELHSRPRNASSLLTEINFFHLIKVFMSALSDEYRACVRHAKQLVHCYIDKPSLVHREMGVPVLHCSFPRRRKAKPAGRAFSEEESKARGEGLFRRRKAKPGGLHLEKARAEGLAAEQSRQTQEWPTLDRQLNTATS